MSDSDHESEKEVIKTDAEIADEVEKKCIEAFMLFDNGNGAINASMISHVLDRINVKLTESEMYKMISEIDPENRGLIFYHDFKPLIVEREI